MAWWRRKTSVAKDVKGLHHEENALDHEKPLKERFEKAQEQDNEIKAVPRPSKMVKDDAPAPSPRPSGPMRWGPDGKAATAKLNQERLEAAAHQERAQKAWERMQQRDKERDLEPGRDRE